MPKPIPPEGLVLEGHRLIPVEMGHTDTDDTTVLHVPDLELVVAGDVVYNGVHSYLSESGHDGLDSWLAALDKLDGLHARYVIAGHKDKSLPDSPSAIDETRRYLLDAKRLLAGSPTPKAYYEEMLKPVSQPPESRPSVVQRQRPSCCGFRAEGLHVRLAHL